MRALKIFALLLLMPFSVAQAQTTFQPGAPVSDTNPAPRKNMCWTGSAYAVCAATGGTGASASQVQGNVASGATDSGNPVKVGGVYSAALPTLTAGQRSDLQLTPKGRVQIATNAGSFNQADSITNAPNVYLTDNGINVLYSPSLGMVFNGSTWDRVRGDTTGTYVVTTPTTAASNAITPVVGSLVNGLVGKASAGNAYSFEVVTGAAAAYLYAFNSATVPADGAVTAGTASGNYQFCQPVAATTGARFGYDIPERYSVGISLAVSSTACGTLTKIATAVFLKARLQ